MIRFIIAIDIEETNLKQAYGRLYQQMINLPSDMDWESTDEVYDGDGAIINPEILQSNRMTYLMEIDNDC